MRQLAGYVNQEDVILSTQTVEEAIMMSIIFRPPPLELGIPTLSLGQFKAVDNIHDGFQEILPKQKHATMANIANHSSSSYNNSDEKLPFPVTTGDKQSNRSESVSVSSHCVLPSIGKRVQMQKDALKAEQIARCSQAISLFGLEKCRATAAGDSMNKGISGGEKKRTSIAMEWVTDTPIMFLDEPTSGLDAYSALMVTRKLKHITEIGRTVIAVLHQPSSEMFELFDDIVIIFEGRIVYTGERANLIDYLARIGYPCAIYSNPADHIFNSMLFDIKVARANTNYVINGEKMEQRAQFMSEMWQQSKEATALQRRINNPELTPIGATQLRRTSPPMVQLHYLLKQTWLNTLCNSQFENEFFAQSISFGLLIGLVYLNSQDRILEWQLHNFSGGMFFNCVAQFLMSSLGVVNVFAHERKVFLRERQGKYYGLPAYYAAKNIVEQPINIDTAMVYSGISYWLSGLERTLAKFLVYMVSMVVIAFNG
ncbi:hypothetical protein GGF37_003585, partial [Kickxella alabastrina]